ncbi:MAG: valine--tRNA ligase [Alphaproteobacteria bacterium]|nr:valine--tRNA ligase [Alphaproteobacteria bacterium]
MMDNRFDPAAVEARIRDVWEKEGAFKAGRPERKAAKPYTIVIPPPNVTGSLHMGHALNNTLQDILCRFERMRGRDVLWQPGTDHAGIATQMVVERQLAERKETSRRDMGRDAFLKRVWSWKEESGGLIINQLKRLGASCDWSRERFTMGKNGAPDDQMVRAVTKVFVELYNKKLIYKDKRLVNWDPHFESAISDLEVVQVDKKGSFKFTRGDEAPFNADALAKALAKDPHGHLYYFDYPVEGATYDPNDPSTFVPIATTRPETMLGDTAIAIHPENKKLKHLIGKHIILPLVGRRVPVVGDEYADPEKGTGAVKITPAHDFNDFEVGKRHAIPAINVLTRQAKIFIEGNETFTPDVATLSADVKVLDGLDRYEARKRVVAMVEAAGYLAKVEPYASQVPHGDRSNSAIEPYLTDQWYVDAKTLTKDALESVRVGRTKFVPENWTKTYYQWLENIESWCVSRQLWWGHQIPVWYGPDGKVFVASNENDASLEAEKHYGIKTDLTRDEDVLDTWFSSALWPFSTLGWPDETPEVARYYPTDVLVTGFDIIFFWVARMMMIGDHFMKTEPFHTVYIHALVRDEKGAKMSKSKGNVIDPLDLIDTYGADALRFTLSAMAAQGRDIKLSTQRIEGYRNFATKLWNAARFAEMNGCARVAGFDPKAVKLSLNKWAIGELATATSDITKAIETYRFNDAANAAYRFTWNVYCDWYLELAKPVFNGADVAAKAETRASIAYVLDGILKILHPFMPYLTEELWAIKGAQGPKRESILALTDWPSLAGLEAPDAEAEIGWLVDLVTEIRSARNEINVPASTQTPLVLVGASAATRDRATRWNDMLKRLARLSDISFADQPPAQSAQMVIRGEIAALPLAGIIDIAAEQARLKKELEKIASEMAKIDAKLNNADFMARAPEEIVEEQHERRAEFAERQVKLSEALSRLA